MTLLWIIACLSNMQIFVNINVDILMLDILT